MKILVINAGSSSLKYELFNKKLDSLGDGYIERIGQKGQIPNHEKAVKQALESIQEKGLVASLAEIKAVGHRVVHGGEKYSAPVRITPSVQKEIQKLCKLAPLHNPPNLAGIKACKKLLPKAAQIAIFDTAFHQTLPQKAFIYALPYDLYKKEGIRRYGFHGTSHLYLSKVAKKLLGKKADRLVTCHLGNGSSLAAVKNGKSIDTTMGFTPLEGVPMGTRSGDIDPAIAVKLSQKLGPEKADNLLNKQSGLLGLTGKSSDMRDLLATRKSNKKSQLAIDIFCYKVAQKIAAFTASLQGLDAIAFTGGIGENSGYIRAQICQYLPHLGVKVDAAKNRANTTLFSVKGSKVSLLAIPADEEKEIASQTLKLL
ncbi:MAG: acetate kinase [Candidatus Gracilibacteria bacterium]